MLNGLIIIKHFLSGEFCKALDSVSAMFNAQIVVWCEIQQSRNWLDIAIVTLGSKLYSDDGAAGKLGLKLHQMTNYRLITTHL